MALMNCPDCGDPVAATAECCPHCGHDFGVYLGAAGPAKRGLPPFSVFVCGVVFVAVILGILATVTVVRMAERAAVAAQDRERSKPGTANSVELSRNGGRRLEGQSPTPEQLEAAGNEQQRELMRAGKWNTKEQELKEAEKRAEAVDKEREENRKRFPVPADAGASNSAASATPKVDEESARQKVEAARNEESARLKFQAAHNMEINKRVDRAIEGYKTIIRDYPNTLAAKDAASRIEELTTK